MTIAGMLRPTAPIDDHRPAVQRRLGPLVGVFGFALVVVAVIIDLARAADLDTDPGGAAEDGAVADGLGVFGLGTIQVGIAIVLVGIIIRLWGRVDAIIESIGGLRARAATQSGGQVPGDQGMAGNGDQSPEPPGLLPIHKMASRMWAPMLMMGVAALSVGLVLQLIRAGEAAGSETFRELAAWGGGTIFLGETLILAGISFLLGTVLAALREGGTRVQRAGGVDITTLAFPTTARAFVALMMMGLMAGLTQFVLSIVVAGKADTPASFISWSVWLVPFRNVAVGLLLAGIILALVTIADVLRFQWRRLHVIAFTNPTGDLPS
jgi:hypothetical protein